MDDTHQMDAIGERTTLSCPDCGGVLWMMPNETMRRYRCHVGHAFSETSLLEGQAEATDQALIVALRTMEDRIKLLEQLARGDRQHNRLGTDSAFEERAAELKQYTQQIRALILGRQI